MRRILTALAAVLVVVGLLSPSAGAYSNGHLPESVLAPIASGVKCDTPAGQLENHAAASYNSMALAAGRKLPTNGCDSAYRAYLRQVYWRSYWCALGRCFNAAVPGLSNHGLGRAVDVPTWVQGWIRLHGKRFGWLKTEAFTEPWHWTFVGNYNRPDPGPNLHSPMLRLHSGGPGQNIYVRKVQKLLRGHGFKTVVVDGSFTTATRKAVRHFQKGQRIPVTGVVNARTWKRLRRPISKPVKSTPRHVPKATHQPPPSKHPKPHPVKPPKVKGNAWGIDTSSNNGTVDYVAARKRGASFAIVKATESTNYLNPYFGRAQMRAITKAGLVPGAYDFLDPSPGHLGKTEAAFFVNAIGHAGFGKGWLPPAADIEQTELSPSGTCHYLGEWVHLVKKQLGVKPMIYGSPGFFASYLSGCSWLVHYKLWVASYGVSSPLTPEPFVRWHLWQYTPSASLGGISGNPFDVSKVKNGRAALVKMRVKELPKRARVAPRAALDLPLAAGPLSELREAAPEPAEESPLSEVPAPEGEFEPAPVVPPASSEVPTGAGAPSLEEAIAELIHALAVAIGG
jgi:lysozyme